jgi:dienelactone hydrolase
VVEGGKTFSSLALRSALNDLISQGYTLLSLAYFKNPGLPSYLEEIPLEYFEKAFAWLATQPEVISKDIALIGGSKGAEVALLLSGMNPASGCGGHEPQFRCVWQGITKWVENGASIRTYRERVLCPIWSIILEFNFHTVPGTPQRT